MKSNRSLELASEALSVALLCGLFYFVLRLPTAPLEISYYDDGETLYHSLSLLFGRVPYRDDISHQFLGYVLPYALVGKFWGWDPSLLKIHAVINQSLTGLGIFYVSRFFLGRTSLGFTLSILAAVLALCAREPISTGFYVQYQINLVSVWSLLVALLSTKRSRIPFLALSYFLAGLGFCFDARALFLIAVPIAAQLLQVRRNQIAAHSGFTPRRLSFGISAILNACCYLIVPAICLWYLYYHQALSLWYEQTIVFTAMFQTKIAQFGSIFGDAWKLHQPLLFDTPFLCAGGLLGLVTMLRKFRESAALASEKFLLLLVYLMVCICMPLLGGRLHDYYTLSWIPALAILTAVGSFYFERKQSWRQSYALLLAFPSGLCLLTAIILRSHFQDYRGDGRSETVRYLRTNLKPEEQVFVWGYRPDFYVYLGKLSPYPFANTLFAEPDYQKPIPSERLLHVFPKYQNAFAQKLATQPPDVIVWFSRKNEDLFTPIHEQFKKFISDEYRLVYETNQIDFTDTLCMYRVYRRVVKS